jgi:ArsR family transcriptional regulator
MKVADEVSKTQKMSGTLKSLRALSDPTRLRIVALLERDELSVNELQEITRLGQSRISTHLGLLSDCALVQSRREGKRTFYKLNPQTDGTAGEFIQLAIRGAKELHEHGGDQINLKRVVNRRREQAQVYFNQIAGRFDRVYGPGRSWQAFGHLLLRILPPLTVADLGSGEGLLSELLARRCKKVIAVDNSEKIVAFGAAKAKKNGLKNLEFRQGDLQNPPIEAGSVDLVILSQALHHAEIPADAIAAAHKILRPRGQILILDLLKHNFGKARELYGDRWPGFAESDLHHWLEGAGFKKIEISVVAREEQPPHFQTILAGGEKLGT